MSARRRINRGQALRLAGWLATIADKTFDTWEDAEQAASNVLGDDHKVAAQSLHGLLQNLGRDPNEFCKKRRQKPAEKAKVEGCDLVGVELKKIADRLCAIETKLAKLVEEWVSQ